MLKFLINQYWGAEQLHDKLTSKPVHVAEKPVTFEEVQDITKWQEKEIVHA